MAFAFLSLIAGINVTNPVANPKWGPLNATGLTFPLLRVGSTSVYDPASNTMILFAGTSSDQPSGQPRLNDVWLLTNANGLGDSSAWSKLITQGGSPPVRNDHSAVYDSVNNRMIINGGCGAVPTSLGCL